MSVQSKEGRERAKLEPTYDQFTKRWIGRVAASKPANIMGPPGYSAEAHVQACLHLNAQRGKRGRNISRPDRRAKTLTAGPGRAAQEHNILLTFCFHSLIKTLN